MVYNSQLHQILFYFLVLNKEFSLSFKQITGLQPLPVYNHCSVWLSAKLHIAKNG